MALLLGISKSVKRPKRIMVHYARVLYVPTQMEPLPSWFDATNANLQPLLGDRGLTVVGWLRIDLDNVDVITDDDEAYLSDVTNSNQMCLGGLVAADLSEVKYFKISSGGSAEVVRGAAR